MNKTTAIILVLVVSACISRGGLNLAPEVKSIPDKLNKISENWEEVIVAPIVVIQSSISEEIFAQNGTDYDAWAEAQRSAVSGEIQDTILNHPYKWDNVRVVDPEDVPLLAEEIWRSIAVGDISMLEIGKMMGATHVVIIRMNRAATKTWNGYRVQDSYSAKLIETESGSVLISKHFFR